MNMRQAVLHMCDALYVEAALPIQKPLELFALHPAESMDLMIHFLYYIIYGN